ncbi:MAG: hypothetical protein CMK70_01990 [Pseudohongiella sp.]|nr:hypothetical protein [Pseudohongiella sp.]|tara:strand:- start:1686 stop:2849 length:1164 start_codon:yes stop_codon:yes gene_type:complete
MIRKQLNVLKPALTLVVSLSVSATALGQTSPELARLYDAFTVTHAAALNAIAEANNDPEFAQARAEMRQHLEQMQEQASSHQSHGQMMSHGMMPASDSSHAHKPDMDKLDLQTRVELTHVVRAEHSDTAAADAYSNIAWLPREAAMVLARGRQFEDKLWDIWANPDMGVNAKSQATQAVIEEYRTGETRHAISVRPKPASLYLDHDYAGSLKSAYPRVSGLLWSNQWLQLASLEAIIRGQVDPQFQGRVTDTLERYENKLGSGSGMSMFPAPVEMPTVPTIAPTLYTLAPEASIIVDNLNMLDAAITDIVAYPDLDAQTREQAILNKVAQFTDENIATDDMSYLLSALRGGIYNQGGPAIGELMGSERNRSRDAMGMQHHMSMSGPN